MGGGDWQNFRRMGGPPVPPGKNPGLFLKKIEKVLKIFSTQNILQQLVNTKFMGISILLVIRNSVSSGYLLKSCNCKF